MKFYLVGGAVRDQLLGLIVQERDWVVVGARPHDLLSLGYQQVGQSFPVFLHPKTHEEYALARTEKKVTHGHQGFQCQFSPEVSLEEDLLRRDLSINAIAMDQDGRLIDPYHGVRDLNQRILRHVSPAFVEDPLRVLRVARFHARFYHLGFKIAAETLGLMQEIVKSGELEFLSKERIWAEWVKGFETQNPEIFVQTLEQSGALAIIAPELYPSHDWHHPDQSPEFAMIHCWSQGISTNILSQKINQFHALSKHLQIPKKLHQLTIKYFKLADFLKNHDMSAVHILHLFQQMDAFRAPEDFLNSLHLANSMLKTSKKIQDILYQALVECKKIKLPEKLKSHEVKAIKIYFEQQRLHCIQQQITKL